MRYFFKFLIAVLSVLLCVNAHAGLGFSFPSLPQLPIGNNKSTPNVDLSDVASNIKKLATDIDEPEEIQIGQGFAATLLGARPLAADPHLQRYVNALGRWLALQTERPDLPWTFAVLEDPGFNALATPGGYIFVTRGLIDRMHNESELAGVLAHEIGHVLRKHYLKGVKQDAVGSLIGSAVTAKAGNSEVKAGLVSMFKNVYKNGLSKDDEFEADRIGVVVAARAGYDPFGLPSVIQMLEGQSAQDQSFSLMLKTHPAPAERLERLDRLMSSRFDSFVGASGATIAERVRQY